MPFNFEHINHMGIRTADKATIRIACSRNTPIVTQNIYIRKGDMLSHGAELPPLRVKIKLVSHLVPPMAGALPLALDQSDGYSGLFHKQNDILYEITCL